MHVTKITVDVKPFDRSLQLPATRLKRIYANGVGSIIVIMINDTWVYIAFNLSKLKRKWSFFCDIISNYKHTRQFAKFDGHDAMHVTVCTDGWTDVTSSKKSVDSKRVRRTHVSQR